MIKISLVNRLEMPTKHILVCEDDIDNQRRIAEHFRDIFGAQGKVQCSFVPGALMAMAILKECTVDLILLDRDMPYGNGDDLLEFMNDIHNKIVTPSVLTFSGIDTNNDILMSLGATYKYSKDEIISGKADAVIRTLLGVE